MTVYHETQVPWPPLRKHTADRKRGQFRTAGRDVTLSEAAERVGRDAGRIAHEVISHLAGIVGAEVKVTLEIEATVQGGVAEDVVRIVTQNSRDLKFETQGFEGDE